MRALVENGLGSELPFADHADGVWVTDTLGRQSLEGASGAVVPTVGHSHPTVTAAVANQLANVTFVHRRAFSTPVLSELATKLSDLTRLASAWFVNSGSEAVEAALQYQVERGEDRRTSLVSFDNGYHGNSLGALYLSGHAGRDAISGLSINFEAIPLPYAHCDAPDLTDAAYAEQLPARSRAQLERLGGTLAGRVVEPVGGATLGGTLPPDGYIQGLRAQCDEFGALLITDEVVSGLRRTGRVLACEHWQVHVDLVAGGRRIGAGYGPIAATLLSDCVVQRLESGSRRVLGGHTYAGNPLSAAAGLVVLELLGRQAVIGGSRRVAVCLAAGLDAIAAETPLVADSRGLGMLRALEFVQTTDPVPVAQRLFTAAMAEGLVFFLRTGGFNDAILIAPPLTITEAEVDDLLGRLARSLQAVEAGAE